MEEERVEKKGTRREEGMEVPAALLKGSLQQVCFTYLRRIKGKKKKKEMLSPVIAVTTLRPCPIHSRDEEQKGIVKGIRKEKKESDCSTLNLYNSPHPLVDRGNKKENRTKNVMNEQKKNSQEPQVYS